MRATNMARGGPTRCGVVRVSCGMTQCASSRKPLNVGLDVACLAVRMRATADVQRDGVSLARFRKRKPPDAAHTEP